VIFFLIRRTYYEELENKEPQTMIWVSISAKPLFLPYSFEEPVNQGTYAAMFRNWFVSEVVLVFIIAWSGTVPVRLSPASLRNHRDKIHALYVQRQSIDRGS